MTALKEPLSGAAVRFEAAAWEEISVVQTQISTRTLAWRPAINAYRCSDRFLIFVELAGVDPATLVVRATPRSIAIHGERRSPEPSCDRADVAQLLAWEIDHGSFSRVLDLPVPVDTDRMETSYRDGLLQVALPLARAA
ncbi:MAG TPA: Hsp20/alpha crystallin family protein [Lacunisphaera sp.]|jgi:HSP20 family protein|nr:Hsp20/alpha crystallin family protein [Lacunisphaera sp.]